MTENQNPAQEPPKRSLPVWALPAGILAFMSLLALVLLIVVFATRSCSLASFQPIPELKMESDSEAIFAPEIELLNLEGKKVRVSDFRGKAILINFWSLSCPACLMELKSLASLSEQLKDKPFVLLAITEDPKDAVQEFLDQTKINLPVYFDIGGQAHMKYGVIYLPISFVIDPEGKVVDKFAGAADWSHPSVITYFQKLIELYQASGINR